MRFGVLFDFFETLVELDNDVPRMWMLLNDLGFSCQPELEDIWNSDGFNGMQTPKTDDTPNYTTWRFNNICQMARQAGVPDSILPDIVQNIMNSERLFTVKAKPGAVSIIRHLRSLNMPIGICSNWDEDIETYLQQSNLLDFDAVITSAAVGFRKPHSKIFLFGCEKLGFLPSSTFLVGDSWDTDIVGALRAGLRPIWISSVRSNPLPNLIHVVPSLDSAAETIQSFV